MTCRPDVSITSNRLTACEASHHQCQAAGSWARLLQQVSEQGFHNKCSAQHALLCRSHLMRDIPSQEHVLHEQPAILEKNWFGSCPWLVRMHVDVIGGPHQQQHCWPQRHCKITISIHLRPLSLSSLSSLLSSWSFSYDLLFHSLWHLSKLFIYHLSHCSNDHHSDIRPVIINYHLDYMPCCSRKWQASCRQAVCGASQWAAHLLVPLVALHFALSIGHPLSNHHPKFFFYAEEKRLKMTFQAGREHCFYRRLRPQKPTILHCEDLRNIPAPPCSNLQCNFMLQPRCCHVSYVANQVLPCERGLRGATQDWKIHLTPLSLSTTSLCPAIICHPSPTSFSPQSYKDVLWSW